MKHLKDLRKAANLTQSQLGDKVNVSVSTIASYEKGRREPDASTALKLAKLFGVSMEYILDKSEIPCPDNLLETVDANMLKDLYTLPFDDREFILKMVRDYVELNKLRRGKEPE